MADNDLNIASISQGQQPEEVPPIQDLAQQVSKLTQRFNRLLAVLEQQQQARNTPDTSTSGASQRGGSNPIATTKAPRTTGTTKTTYPSVIPAVRDKFNALTIKELAKQSLSLPKKQHLSGPENYQQ